MNLEQCTVCRIESEEKLSNITEIGLPTLVEYLNHVQPDRVPISPENFGSLRIHRSCFKKASNEVRKKQKVDNANNLTAAKKAKVETRSSSSAFDWKIDCLFCGGPCTDSSYDPKHPDRNDFHRCEDKLFRDSILKKCKSLDDDDQARDIERRLLSCSDLIAVKGRYHDKCS